MSKDTSITTQVASDEFVADMVASLRNDDQVDAELLDILSENIVKLDPDEAAVSDAVKAIEELAAKRAEGTDNGHADHD